MPRIALIHDWLTGFRGGERVLQSLCRLYPDATLFTLVHRKGSQPDEIERMEIRTSFIQKLPLSTKIYRHYLPLFPTAVEQFDLRNFDLVISSSHCAAKGVLVPSGSLHICYCHTPMRYIWDLYHEYFDPQRLGPLSRLIVPRVATRLRIWDRVSSLGVDHFVANSRFVARRIEDHYRRESVVIHPPADVETFVPAQSDNPALEDDGGFYLMVSALSPYKKVDIAIDAFNSSGRRLKIIGFGPEERKLKRHAGPTIEFLGVVPLAEIVRQYQGCRALVHTAVEDFGLAPVEAQACGRPVVAFGRGGVLESVIPGKTGLFYEEQTAEAIDAAVDKLETIQFNERELREHARNFSDDVFQRRFRRFVEEKMAERESRPSSSDIER